MRAAEYEIVRKPEKMEIYLRQRHYIQSDDSEARKDKVSFPH